ncbi:MAG: sulfite exporter TauE/SafE family protein [Lachnospiraceae bacterium]|jgi:uncharacterized membrane protein YfcA
MRYIFFILPAIAGGFVQSVTGFGCGIIIMMFYPILLGVIPSATINQCASIFLCLSIIIPYWKYANRKAIVLPLVFYFPIYLLLLQVATSINVDFLKPFLGLFLILISIYFIFANNKITITATPVTTFICAGLCASIDAFFGLGGPPIVIYFLNTTKDKKEYFGTLQTFFLTTAIYGTLMRTWKGVLTLELIPNIIIAVLSILIGAAVGKRLASRLNGEVLKKVIYAFIGFAGIITIFESREILLSLF